MFNHIRIYIFTLSWNASKTNTYFHLSTTQVFAITMCNISNISTFVIIVREHLESCVNLVVKANQSLSLLKGTPKNIKKLVGSLKSKWYIFGGVLKNGLIYT